MRFAMAMLFFTPLVALAHGMVIHTPIISQTGIRVTVTFDDDEPLIRGTVKLLDREGKEVSRATTNEQGVVDLPRPPFGTYTLRADDGGSHAKTMQLLVSGELVNVDTSPPPNKLISIAVGLAAIAGVFLIWLLLRNLRGTTVRE